MSQSTVITTGFGSFGSVNLIPVLGFGGSVAAATQPHGRIVRHGKSFLWPEWEQQQEAIAEESRLTAQMAQARTQRDILVADLRRQKELSGLAVERDRIARTILDIQQRARAALRKLERDRNALRNRRKQLVIRLDQVRREQEIEDMRAIAFVIGEFYE